MESKGSEEGFLKTANPPHPNPTILKVSLASNDQTSVLVTGREIEEENIRTLRFHSALSKRGWAFQEVILSHRSLFFGTRQLYWECHNGLDSLEGLHPCQTGYRQDVEVIVPRTHGQPERSDSDTQSDFYILATGYNSKSLTYGSDKLPAFSGLAGKFQHAFGGEYLAGLWSNDLHRGLLWFSPSPPLAESAAQANHLPSWSWASTNEWVQFVTAQPQHFLELHSFNIQLCNPQNRYGDISTESDATRPSITVIGMTMPLARGNCILDPDDQGPDRVGGVTFDVIEELEEESHGSDGIPLTIIDDSFMLSFLHPPRVWLSEDEDEDEDWEGVEDEDEEEDEEEDEDEDEDENEDEDEDENEDEEKDEDEDEEVNGKGTGARYTYPGLKCDYLALAVSGKLSGTFNAVHGLILQESGDAFKRVGVWKAHRNNWSWKGWERDQMLKLV
ncbi:hypothetical protein BHE90_016249 [Fusarium euwallaceae]|uniref:Heterokaryon incompatibility domain-containing protein n=1 Tax=Fusarium euwallaceae TaxID=1147111 RepID=A0A430L108_9HYPO|nr:hypothetical protein BHE90_016249 [Fusarium euwallaceae]